MSWANVAIIGSAVIGGVASRYASKTQAKAGGKAGDATLQAAQETIAEQKRQYDLTRSDMAPWMQAGTSALSAQQEMLFGPQDDPYGEFGGTTMNFAQGDDGTWSIPSNEAYSLLEGPTGGTPSWFDEQAYMDANPDVQAEYDATATGNRKRVWENAQYGELGRPYTPYDHYQDYGRQEGRNLGAGQVDPSVGAPLSPEEEAYMNEFVDPSLHDQFRQTPQAERAKYVQAGGQTAGTPDPYLPSQDYIGTQLPGRDYADFAGPEGRGPLGAGAPIPGRANLPGALGPADLGVTGPEFVDPDTSMEAFQASAPYEAMMFELEQGGRGLNAGRASLGSRYSGAADKEMARYVSGVTNQRYGDFFGQATGAARDRNINEVYGYESDQQRRIQQAALNRRAWSDLSAQEMALYGMDQTVYEQAQRERATQFDASGILYGEQYGAAEGVRERGIQDYTIDYGAAVDEYSMRRGESEDYYGKLTGISGTGMATTSNLAQIGQNTAANIGNVRTQAGVNAGNTALYQGAVKAQGIYDTSSAVQQGITGFTNYLASRPPPPTAAQNLYGDYGDVGNYYTG